MAFTVQTAISIPLQVVTLPDPSEFQDWQDTCQFFGHLQRSCGTEYTDQFFYL